MTPADAVAAPPPRRRQALLVAAVVAALAVTAVVAYRWGMPDAKPPVAAPSPSPSPSEAPTTAELYSALAPSVVTIEALDASTGKVASTGTGVVANTDGLIMTALHVVNGAGKIRVTFADGTPSAATVADTDPANDIATLTAATMPTVIVPAVLGNSGRLAIGDSVLAIGNPLGLTGSATTGVVSGLARTAKGTDGTSLAGLIQFDAAVNPGSSGGPLVNAKGETIGIVVALANPTTAGTFIGIGFAVPIGTALSGGGPSRGPQQ